MKKITLLLFMFFAVQGFAQVALGSGTTPNKRLPFDPSYDYSYGQSLYLASEISASGNITSIQWYYNGPGLTGLANSQLLKIYLGHTTKSQFATTTDWVPYADLFEVYEGGITVTGAGWVTITFTTPFAYNGTDNLVVAISELKPGRDNVADDFFTFEVAQNRSMAYNHNILLPNPVTPQTANFRQAFVPNVIFGGITQACPTLQNLEVTEFTSTTATINWSLQANPPAGGSQYYVSESNVAPTATTEPSGSIESGNGLTITTGLVPATTYYLWVRDVCEGGPGGWSLWPTTFTTACETFSDFNEGFEGLEYGTLPTCWSSLVIGDGISEAASVIAVDLEALSGMVKVEMSNADSDNTSSDIILITPELSNLSAGTHRLKFAAKGANGALQIGTMDANDDSGMFTPIDAVVTTITPTDFAVDFTTYEGTDKYIAIRLNATEPYVTVSLDDIRWEVAPPCFDVEQINVTSVTTTTATVEWLFDTDQGSFDLVYSTDPLADPSTLTPITPTVTGLATTLEGLQQNTTYYLWMRSICNAGNGIWIGPVAFTTACTAVSVINENFDSTPDEGLSDCWRTIFRGAEVSEYAFIRSVTSALTSEPKAVVFSNLASGEDSELILVAPAVNNLTAGTHVLRFFARGTVSEEIGTIGSLVVGTLNANTPNAVFTPFSTIDLVEAVTEYTLDFSEYAGTDTYIGIRFIGPMFTYAFIDDFRWEPVGTCVDVSEVKVGLTTTTTAAISWTAGATETAWDVVYGPSTVTDPSTLTPLDPAPTTTGVVLEGLANSSYYNVWVRSVCPTDNGEWIGPVTFHTDCEGITEFVETFEDSDELPTCWRTVLRGETLGALSAIGVTGLTPLNGDHSVYFWGFTALTAQGDDIILVSPRLENLAAGTHNLTFHAKNIGALQIGTMSSNDMDGEFSLNETIETSSTYEEYSSVFTNYTGTDRYIGIRLAYDTNDQLATILLDDIRWEPALSVDKFKNSALVYYPNPVTDMLNLSNEKNISSIEVFNMLGQKVIAATIDKTVVQVDMSELPTGTYMVKVATEDGTDTIKVIKK